MIDLPIGHSRPGDTRGFVHKRILGAVSTVASIAQSVGVPGAGAVSRVSRAFAGGRRTLPRTTTARVTQLSQAEKNRGRNFKFGDGAFTNPNLPRGVVSRVPPPFGGGGGVSPTNGPCPPGMRPDFQSGQCEAAAGQAVGEAIMGRYGAGVLPGSIIIDRAVCGKKMQLGDDGVCYNRSQISNKQRMWPAGRRPLLTGGDMRAISIASRAGKRMDGATARLRKLGMMKKAPVARAAPKPATVHEQIAMAHALK